ncbi:MAG TPA: GSU2403 family nucleotidyltransferase fold protein [Pedococcus sp.]|jgi:hypothetical protein|nr:GSU2403 family nucleotidyltransferase fold protein [Pedococcus sp.]
MNQVPPEYAAARTVLLDALDALHDHMGSLVLVGAQAVYLHTGAGTLSVPVMTTDADLALDTSDLQDDPEIGSLMRAAGFVPRDNPGHWIGAGEVAVDLMVVPHQGNPPKATSRSARIPPHDKTTARITPGLEAALVDKSPMTIGSLDPHDPRSASVQVAGPAALLVAKLIKISERAEQPRGPARRVRLREKDALDAFRLLQATETADLVGGFRRHSAETNSAKVSERALAYLRAEASRPDQLLPGLASAAVLGDPTVAISFIALSHSLLDALA